MTSEHMIVGARDSVGCAVPHRIVWDRQMHRTRFFAAYGWLYQPVTMRRFSGVPTRGPAAS